MPAPVFAHLSDRALIRVSGADAQHFLQNLVTADIDGLSQGGATAAALLTPQGKILFDFLVYRTADAYLLDAPEVCAAELLKRLTFYRLRAKVDLSALEAGTGVVALWHGEAAEPAEALVAVDDPRLAALGRRLVGPVAALTAALGGPDAGLAAYHAHRIGLGVPEGLQDYGYSDIFPHDADLDQLGAVSFSKGCYVGQEVVSRVHHKGSARKRFVMVEADAPLPARGTEIDAGGKSVGEIGSSTGDGELFRGLALLRLDKVVSAKDNGHPLTCGDARLEVQLPEWARFTWPEQSAD